MMTCLARNRSLYLVKVLRGPLGLSARYQQSRTVRTKGGTGFYDDALRRDERLLRRLEAQLANVQAKIKREEAEAQELMEKQNHHGVQNPQAESGGFQNHNFYFWEKVLTPADRKRLASHGIQSMDELFSTYEVAESKMKQPPYPTIEQLEPRLQYGLKVYQSIPKMLSEAGHAKAKSRSGGWF